MLTSLANLAPEANTAPAARPGAQYPASWHRLFLQITAAPTVEDLQQIFLRGMLDLTPSQAARLELQHEGVTLPVAELSRARAKEEAGAWRRWPVEWDGAACGTLALLGAGPDEDWGANVTLACEHLAAVFGKTRLFQQLQTIKSEWQAMLDGMIDGVYVCDSAGNVLRANRALAAVLGKDIPSILGRNRDELWASLPDYQVLRPWQTVEVPAAELSSRVTEFRCCRPERIYVEMAFDLGTGEAQSVQRSLCVLHDVTESRRLQEQLLQSEKLAALGELTSGVAHELNNPLATVVGYAELLELETSLPESVRRKLRTVHQEATRASHIVQNLLAYARRSAPEKAFVNINDVLEATVEMRRYQLNAEDVRLITDFAENLPPVWADPLQLQQVLLNIVNNAVQAVRTWRGSGEIKLFSRAALLHGEPAVRVTIEDNGPGIAPDHLRRVFDPFFTTKPTGEGTGLGMSIALRIVSNHDGLLWAESRLGHGARFVLELPASGTLESSAGARETGEAPAQGAEVQAYNASRGRRVLVIDDEEPVVTLISEILMMDGHEVTPAFNGAEAIALLRAEDYDLILSDVRMPAVGGPTFFEILQTTRPDLLPKVIFVTGDTMSSSTQEFLRKAGRPVLAKPFDPEKLRQLVAANLARTAGN